MNLEYLKINYFRNLKSVLLEPAPGLNLFIGDNGQGKTNLLDAIAIAAQSKPVRAIQNNQDLITFGESQARIEARFNALEDALSVVVNLDLQGKKVQVNQKTTRDSQYLRNKIALVSFVPEDLGAVMGGASLRRKLLDQITASLYPTYVLYYRRYEKVLIQRNQLLKQPIIDWAQLDSFTEILSQTADSLEQARNWVLGHIQSFYQEVVEQLSHRQISSQLDYKPSSQGNLKASLDSSRREEQARKTTILGPHLDDLKISLNNHPARFVASRGQARMLILALKMAQLQAIKNRRDLKPILLLDDVVGELDPGNALRLLEVVDKLETQTFIATTDLKMLPIDWQRKESIFYLPLK